jgi:hypothetical protein
MPYMNEAHSKIQYVLVTRQIKDVTEERLLILHFERKIQKIQKIGFFYFLQKIMIFSNPVYIYKLRK